MRGEVDINDFSQNERNRHKGDGLKKRQENASRDAMPVFAEHRNIPAQETPRGHLLRRIVAIRIIRHLNFL